MISIVKRRRAFAPRKFDNFLCTEQSPSVKDVKCHKGIKRARKDGFSASGVVAGGPGGHALLNMGANGDKGAPKFFACNIWLGTSYTVVRTRIEHFAVTCCEQSYKTCDSTI